MNHCSIKLICTVVSNKPWQTSLIPYQHGSLSLSPLLLPCPNTQPLWFGQFSQGTQELRLLLSCNFLSFLYTNEERERRIKGSKEKRCTGKSKMDNANHFKVPWTGNDIWFPLNVISGRISLINTSKEILRHVDKTTTILICATSQGDVGL